MVYFNVNTVTGRNLRKMYLETNVDPLASEKAWQCLTYHPLHESERYKIDMIHELTDAKFGVTEVALSSQEIGVILRTICCD